MKKLTRSLPIMFFLIFDLVINVVTFLTVDPVVLEYTSFWVSWAFAYPIGFGIMLFLTLYITKDKETRMLSYRTLDIVHSTCNGLYVTLFGVTTLILSKAKPETIDKLLVYFIIALVVITGGYLALIAREVWHLSVLRETNADQKKTIEQKKSTFIPELSGMVASAIAMADQAEVKAKLEAFSLQLAQSEILSPDSVAITERELKAIVYQINQFVTIKEYATIDSLIAQANLKLMERNQKCQLSRMM